MLGKQLPSLSLVCPPGPPPPAPSPGTHTFTLTVFADFCTKRTQTLVKGFFDAEQPRSASGGMCRGWETTLGGERQGAASGKSLNFTVCSNCFCILPCPAIMWDRRWGHSSIPWQVSSEATLPASIKHIHTCYGSPGGVCTK